MNQEEKFKNKHRKIDKHFIILINNRKVKILNYQIELRKDKQYGQEKKVLTIITKIFNEIFYEREIHVLIDNDSQQIEFQATYYGGFSQPGLKRYIYILNEKEI